MAPTIDGVPLFGSATRESNEEAPRALYQNNTFGENGIAAIDGGGRGRTWWLTGLLTGWPPFAGMELVAALASLRGYDDGRTHTYTDCMGLIWGQVLLDSVATTGPWRTAADGSIRQPFRCRLTSLE